jgi:hypothetical protein
MITKKILAIASGVALLCAANANATLYVDNNGADVWLNANNQSYTGQFNLTDYGFNPATEQIVSANACFTLFDLFGRESYDILIDGTSLFSGGSFCGLINLRTGITGSLLASLNVDGILNYTIQRTSGEFWLTNARLTASTGSNGGGCPNNRVPDGGTTMALLGLGILGLAAVRRKLA